MDNYGYLTADPAWYCLLKELAKKNRKFPTEAEAVLWKHIKGNALGVPFRQQHIIGDYIVDFFCLPKKLVIEVDGGYHAELTQQELDKNRTSWLRYRGYHLIRFTNEEVLHDIEKVLEIIKSTIDSHANK
ncbi:MAG TPA: cytosine methyltransferase [Prevotellaceae bacterium]|nr:cytosine methyltransferase [Prevotellaceae bacterium]HBE54662.1 cytosine methyltransferase [Prevotellaceae bacterium]